MSEFLIASVVEKFTPKGETKERSYWTDVGRAFPHTDGKGFTLNIRSGLSINGQIVLREPRPDEREAAVPPVPAGYESF